MPDFWEKFNSGQISDEELFRHLFFFEKAVGGAEYISCGECFETKSLRDWWFRRQQNK